MPGSKKQLKRKKRHKRVRARVSGSVTVPRLCVTRTNTHIYAQLINDDKGYTLLTAGDLEIKTKGVKKVDLAREVGKLIAEKALRLRSGQAQGKKIEKVIFDRGGYKYHGRVKSLAEGAREGGLKF